LVISELNSKPYLPLSKQKNKMASCFSSVAKEQFLLADYSTCVVHVYSSLKQLFDAVSVKVMNIYLHFDVMLSICICQVVDAHRRLQSTKVL